MGRKRKRRRVSAKRRRIIMRRDNYHCRYCNRGAKELKGQQWHIDHVKPLAWRGNDYTTNLVLSCESCNLLKGAHHWEPLPINWFRSTSALIETINEKDYPELKDVI